MSKQFRAAPLNTTENLRRKSNSDIGLCFAFLPRRQEGIFALPAASEEKFTTQSHEVHEL